MNEYIGNVSSRDQEYVLELPNEELDHQWHQIGPEYPSDKAGDCYGDRAKVQKLTLHASTLFGLGMGPEFSSDISGDGPRKRIFDEEDFDPELERSKKRKIWNSRRSKLSRQIDNAKQNSKRSTDNIMKNNAKRNPTRSTDDRRKDNAKQNRKR